MVTTIQLNECVKQELEHFKTSKQDTYEMVIKYLVKTARECKRANKQLLVQGYKEMASESLKVSKDWDSADASWS